VFKREEKLSLGRYTQKLRIERAKQLLGETAMSIDHVRKLAGFRSRAHFYRAFQQSEGVTPMAFRDQR
jgi:AraC family transcriptional regulator